MNSQYRIERSPTPTGGLLPVHSLQALYHDRSLAVAVAIKSVNDPERDHVRVVHIATGEVVFDSAHPRPPASP
jgi:hypothetical protein